jgi:hypothetical protein
VRYWLDTEFIAAPYSIDLISIGLVAEDGREFYAESNEVDWSKANLWTLANVRPQLDGRAMERVQIGYAVRQFTDGDEHPGSGAISRLTTGWRSPGCSAIWTNCRSTIRSSASTSNNGRWSSAIQNCRIRPAPGIMLCTTHAGRGTPGRFWRACIPPARRAIRSEYPDQLAPRR